MTEHTQLLQRRTVMKQGALLGLSAILARAAPAYAWSNAQQTSIATSRGPQRQTDLEIGDYRLTVNGRPGSAMAINGTIPGPLLRFREGEQAVIRVTNRLEEIASIHWHGLILPAEMDGVPGVSFGGISPGQTFTYRFPLLQSGTYWCHSHSGGQELLGVYAPFIVDPADSDPFAYEQDYVVVLSDWSFDKPERIIANLKKQAGYYNYQKRTVTDFLRDARRDGWSDTLKERLSWSKMRMDPTDFADVTGFTYTYLLNGLTSDANWTGVFKPGQRVRLRFIAAGAMTFFDIRIPGLKMSVVQADGQNVQPVEIDEFRIGPGETYDVIVQPDDQAYTLFAEAMDRSGFVRGTLAPRLGMSAPIPPRRPRPLRTMTDMGMDMSGMDMPRTRMDGSRANSNRMAGIGGAAQEVAGTAVQGHGTQGMELAEQARATADGALNLAHEMNMSGTATPTAEMPGMARSAQALPAVLQQVFPHGRDTHGPGNSSIAMVARGRLHEPGSGFDTERSRVLAYSDLKSIVPQTDQRLPAREVELHITGNMERYMWSFDGKKYSEARAPIPFRQGERLRLVFVNDTMMEHPIHLHGMWMELENGAGPHQPLKHTVNVKPAERLSVAITPDVPGRWAMHCHLLLHMEAGMFRVVEVLPA